MRTSALAIATLLAALAGVGPAPALTGGAPAGADLAAHSVMVLNDRGGVCTGAVLGPRLILTAGHCVRPGGEHRVHWMEPAGPRLEPVDAVVLHPRYSDEGYRKRLVFVDLALVRLSEPLPARFRPMTVSANGGPAAPGTPYRIAGFGEGAAGDAGSMGTLREATLTAAPPGSTIQLRLTDPTKAGRGACQGDSGGLVVEPSAPSALVAVLTWTAPASGPALRRCAGTSGATFLAPHRDWIGATAARLGTP